LLAICFGVAYYPFVGTLNAIYVRVTEPAKAAAVRVAYPTAYTEPGSQFYAIEQTGFEPPEAELGKLSARLGTDVLWLGFQSVVDAFQFHHWRSGKHMRSLVFGCFEQERTWERVEGEPEAWERAAIFDPKHLARLLRHTASEEADALRQIWCNAEIAPSRMEPMIDGRETARKVAEFYRLPGWS